MTDPPAPRRGAVAVIWQADRLLVICRSATVVAPGAYCFPGGHIEPGETEEQAVVRELREELNALAQPMRRVWRSVSPSGVELHWWQAELASDAALAPNPAEVASVHWMTPDELAAQPKLLSSNRDFLELLRTGQIVL